MTFASGKTLLKVQGYSRYLPLGTYRWTGHHHPPRRDSHISDARRLTNLNCAVLVSWYSSTMIYLKPLLIILQHSSGTVLEQFHSLHDQVIKIQGVVLPKWQPDIPGKPAATFFYPIPLAAFISISSGVISSSLALGNLRQQAPAPYKPSVSMIQLAAALPSSPISGHLYRRW